MSLLNPADKRDREKAMKLFRGDNSRVLRDKAGMSQAEIAELIGTDQSIISQWETGKHKPRVLNAVYYYNVLRTRVEAVLCNGAEVFDMVLNSNA